MATKHKSTPGRSQRVADQIQRDIADILRNEVKDRNIGLVTVNEVQVTPDYAHAKVFYTLLNDDEAAIAATQDSLKRASGFIRSCLGKRLHIHTLPQLTFVYDSTLVDALKLSNLIDQANATRVPDDDGEEGGKA